MSCVPGTFPCTPTPPRQKAPHDGDGSSLITSWPDTRHCSKCFTVSLCPEGRWRHAGHASWPGTTRRTEQRQASPCGRVWSGALAVFLQPHRVDAWLCVGSVCCRRRWLIDLGTDTKEI
ncbi:uncharacterized protein LOC118145600 [Callithrix jacchus]